jgi:hypothetical protein
MNKAKASYKLFGEPSFHIFISNFLPMKAIRSMPFYFFFALALLTWTTCSEPTIAEDDATPYIVTINFNKPIANQFKKGQFVPLDIRFDRNPSGGFIHHVQLEIRTEKDSLVAIVFEKYVRTLNTFTFSHNAAFKTDKPGQFKIKALTTDEVGKQANSKNFNFQIIE